MVLAPATRNSVTNKKARCSTELFRYSLISAAYVRRNSLRNHDFVCPFGLPSGFIRRPTRISIAGKMLSKPPFLRSPRYEKRGGGAEGQTRTVDTGIFSAVLYHLSYLGLCFYYRIRRGGCQGGNSLEQHFDACSTTAGGRFIVEGDMPSPWPSPRGRGKVASGGKCNPPTTKSPNCSITWAPCWR